MTSHHYTLADQIDVNPPNPQGKDVFFEKEPRSSSDLESPVENKSFPTSQWTIGWVTPSSIIAFLLLATTIASAHLGFFHYLNGREVDKSIKQPYVTATSLVFANAFRTFLAAALGICFVQMLWKDLRARPMRVCDLDSFLSVLANPLHLFQFSLIMKAPFPFLCAAMCWCIPVAMIFPPGALTVEPKTLHLQYNHSVPTLDSSFTGNGTFRGMMNGALWELDLFEAYSGPTNQLTRVARQAIMGAKYLTSPSPCGQNCSYTIEINGPSYECHDYVSPNLFSWVNQTYPQSESYPYLYIAYTDYAARTNSSEYYLDIQLQWMQDSDNIYQNLTCVAYDSTYKFNMSFFNGEQHTTTAFHPNKRLNSSYFYSDYTISPEGGADPVVNATSTGSTGGNTLDINRRMNLAAIHDSLTLALSGYIDIFLLHNQPSANTIISLSDLYSGPIKSPRFNITPSTIQSLLQNITLSLLTLNQTTTTALVTETTIVNIYSFQRPVRLLTPYLLCLTIALAFAIGGGHALVSNGISASTGGMLQTLCTTRGSERLNDLAAKGCLGGRENVPDDLMNLKVMFGELKSSSGVRMAGLGPEEEVIPLIKGSI